MDRKLVAGNRGRPRQRIASPLSIILSFCYFVRCTARVFYQTAYWSEIYEITNTNKWEHSQLALISLFAMETTHVCFFFIRLKSMKRTFVFSSKKHPYSVYLRRRCRHAVICVRAESSIQSPPLTFTQTLSPGSSTGAQATGRMEKVEWRVCSSHSFQGGGSRWAEDESAPSRRRRPEV